MAPPGHTIDLRFSRRDVEPGYDWITVFDGPITSSHALLPSDTCQNVLVSGTSNDKLTGRYKLQDGQSQRGMPTYFSEANKLFLYRDPHNHWIFGPKLGVNSGFAYQRSPYGR